VTFAVNFTESVVSGLAGVDKGVKLPPVTELLALILFITIVMPPV
jgi:hypothetical protein